jgi:oligopeptidase B
MASTRTRLLGAVRQLARRTLIPMFGVSAAVGLSSLVTAQAPPHPPMAKKVPKTTTLHGITLTDDYAWLREKGTPEVTAYLEAENAYTEAGTAHTAPLRETLYTELLGRIKESD